MLHLPPASVVWKKMQWKKRGNVAQQLPKGAAGKELQQALLPGEQVLGWASGKGGSHLIATDQRALIIKAGIATGQFFGRKVNAYPYAQLTSVELQTGMLDGYVQLSAGGAQGRTLGSRVQQMQADNTCAFNKGDEKAFRAVVAILRERVATVHQAQASGGQNAAAPAAPSIPDQIAQLAHLRDQGILSPDEFEAKKADLLNRM